MKSMLQERRPQTHTWVRRVEHGVLRFVSLVFSVVSAHAILWFFSALDWVDPLQPYVKWGMAIGFGILGYFVSRGLAHRLLNKEPVRAYVFICGLFEFVEVVCNYSMAASSSAWIVWLGRVHGVQHTVLVPLVQVVLSIIPLVTVMLAWVDMDLERAKQGYEVRGFGIPPAQANPMARQPVPPAPWQPSGASVVPPVQRAQPPYPKQAPVYPTMQPPATAPHPTYQQGYAPSVARSAVSSLSVPSAISETTEPPAAQGGWFSGLRSNVGKAVGVASSPFSRQVPVERSQD